VNECKWKTRENMHQENLTTNNLHEPVCQKTMLLKTQVWYLTMSKKRHASDKWLWQIFKPHFWLNFTFGYSRHSWLGINPVKSVLQQYPKVQFWKTHRLIVKKISKLNDWLILVWKSYSKCIPPLMLTKICRKTNHGNMLHQSAKQFVHRCCRIHAEWRSAPSCNGHSQWILLV